MTLQQTHACRCTLQLCERLPSPNGESAVECSSLSSMPNVAFTIGGQVFDLSPEEVSVMLIVKALSCIPR